MATTVTPAPKTKGRTAAKKPPARKPEDCPDFTRPQVHALEKLRQRCRDLVGSETESATDVLHAKSDVYLPKWGGEDDDNYKVRCALTEVYGGFERCVVASRGLVFAKPPALEDGAPQIVQDHWEDVDGLSTHARVFLKDVFFDGLIDGIVGIRVDFPRVTAPPGTLGLDQWQRENLRPRWIKVTADQIINWKIGMVDQQPMLTLLVLHECVDEDVGEFGMDTVEQYRVYRLVQVPTSDQDLTLRRLITFQVWRKKEVDRVITWYVYDEGEIRGPKRIPVEIGYLATASAPLVAKPPLAALADLNLGHYRVSADRRFLMTIAHAPTPVIEHYVKPMNPDGTTAPEAAIHIGPGAALKLEGAAVFNWKQADPTALDSSKEEKEDLQNQMAAMSIAFMSHEKRSQETATAHRINAMSQNASLAIAAEGLRDLATATLELHCQFLGIDESPDVSLNTAYDEGVLDAQTIAALNSLEKDANITKGTLLLVLQRGKVLPEDVDIKKEELLLATEAINRAQLASELASAGAGSGGGAGGGGGDGDTGAGQ